MKFSIITPCYNSEKTIRQTIESVLYQTDSDYEYIIIDGKSTDGTLEIIEEYCDKFGDRLQVISEKDNGIYDAMNKGIRLASGDYIGIINSDDWYEKEALENVSTQIHQRQESGKDTDKVVFYGMMRFIEHGKERRCALYNHEFLADNMINHPTVFVSRLVYEQYGVFDCTYKAVADYDYMLKLYNTAEIEFVPIYKMQANFRIGGMTSSYRSVVEAMVVKKKYGIISKHKFIVLRILLWLRKILGFMGNE